MGKINIINTDDLLLKSLYKNLTDFQIIKQAFDKVGMKWGKHYNKVGLPISPPTDGNDIRIGYKGIMIFTKSGKFVEVV